MNETYLQQHKLQLILADRFREQGDLPAKPKKSCFRIPLICMNESDWNYRVHS